MSELKPCPVTQIQAYRAYEKLLEIMEDETDDQTEAFSAAYKALYWIANDYRAQPANEPKECPAMERVEGGIPYCISVCDRLAAYEDAEDEGRLIVFESAEKRRHIQELAAAEKDGRCAILPCKVGDTVYIVNDSNCIDELTVKYIQSALNGTLCFQAECENKTEDCYCGSDAICAVRFSAANMAERKIFLTFEAAKAALKAGDTP